MLDEAGSSDFPSRERNGSCSEISPSKAKEEQGDVGSAKATEGSLEGKNTIDSIQHQNGLNNSQEQKLFGFNPPRSALASTSTTSQQPPTSQDTRMRTMRSTPPTPTISRSCFPEPPVTKATLSELDVPRIVLNPKLRHDVNFDPDLHFRPNLDGEKGRRKAQKASNFWNTLRMQLQAFMENPDKFETELEGRDWCLPITLRAIGEILETLVPPDDRSAVEEILNVELLMQQFSKGVADLEKLAHWLSKTLKLHCAPMRDEWVNEMVTQLSLGNQNRDVCMLSQGLQTLMGVLEAMKLDVANHQIRCLRPLLIQDTVEFEQTFFLKKIAMRKIDITYAHAWFQASAFSGSASPRSEGDMAVFFRGFANLIMPSRVAERVPETFMFDEERIVKLRTDMLDAINMEVCIRLFRKLQTGSRVIEPQSTFTSSSPSWSNSGSFSSGMNSPLSTGLLSSPTIPTLPDFQRRIKNSQLAKEQGRFVKSDFPDTLVWVPGATDSGMPSPASSSSSLSSLSSSPEPFCFTSQPTSNPSNTEQESTLRASLLAILEDAPPESKWQIASPALALQILRTTTSSPSISSLSNLPAFEQKLQFNLSNLDSGLFQQCEAYILSSLLPRLDVLITRYAPLTSTKLFEVAVSSPSNSANNNFETRPSTFQMHQSPNHSSLNMTEDGGFLMDAARQIAHIGILHWRVWAPLAYLVNPDVEEAIGSRQGGAEGQMEVDNDVEMSSPVDIDNRRMERRRSKRRSRQGGLGTRG